MSADRGRPARWRAACALSLLLGVLGVLVPRPARAAEEGWSITLFPGYASLTGPFGMVEEGFPTQATSSGFGVGLEGTYGLGEGFTLRALGSYSHHPGAIFDGRSVTVGHAAVGFGYSLDVLRLVPTFELAPGFYAHTQADGTTRYEFGLEVGLSVDYFLTPRWAVGVMARYHIFLSNATQFPAYLQIGPRVGFHWQ